MTVSPQVHWETLMRAARSMNSALGKQIEADRLMKEADEDFEDAEAYREEYEEQKGLVEVEDNDAY